MQQLAHAETSYSALLHGPDTPPFNSEPAWGTAVVGEHHRAAEYFNWSSQGATVKDRASSNECEGPSATFVTQNFWPQRWRTEQKLLTKDTSNFGGADAKEQVPFHPNVVRQIQHLVRHSGKREGSPHQLNPQQGFHGPSFSQQQLANQKWFGENRKSFRPCEREDASLPNNGPSFMQPQQCAMNFNLECNDVIYAHAQPQQDIADRSFFRHQEGTVLPSRAMPPGQVPNGFDPQQYSAWNVMDTRSMGGTSGSHMQHPSDTGYNRWDTSAWLEGHPSVQHTPYLPYGSGHMQIGANPASCNWQTQSARTMTAPYSHYYPEGYYSCSNNINGVGENNAAPPAFVNYNNHYQEPGVFLPAANQFPTRFRSFHERHENTGGQIRQLQSTCEDPSQSANIVKKSREEEEVQNGNAADKETACCEKDVELEGPQAKKMREYSEVGAYHLKSCQVSPQTGASSSINVAELSGVDGTPSSSRNSSDVQGSALHSSIKGRQSQAFSQGCGFESGIEQQGRSSEIASRMLQKSGTPSHLGTKDITQAETSANLIAGHSFYRNHTRSTSFVYSSEIGSGLPQSDSIHAVSFLPGAQQMQEHERNAFVPGGFHDGYKEELSSNRTIIGESGAHDQFSTDLLMRQLGGRAQVVSPPGAHSPFKTSTFQQRPMLALAPKSAFSGIQVSSGAAIQELPEESQCAMFKPSNIGEGPGTLNASNVSYGDIHTEHFDYSTPGHNYSSIVDKDEYLTSNLYSEAEQQRTLYFMSTSAYPSHLRPAVQTEIKPFDHSKAGPSETGAQLRESSWPTLEKFYLPPPFHSHPLHIQREFVRGANTPSEGETALENCETALLTSEMKERASQLVNYKASAGYMVNGGFLYPAADGSGMTKRGSVLSESGQVHQLPVSSGNVSRQQPGNAVFYAHAPGKVPSNTISSHTHSSSITIGSQGSAGSTQILNDNETLKSSQPSGYPDPVATGRNLRQANEDRHPPPAHYGVIHTVSKEYSTTIDGEVATSGQTLSEQIPQQALKANARAPRTMQPKKRKKPVPCLIPWHILTAQPRGQLPSLSKAELMWTTATNRLLDKDGGEVSNVGIFRAESRLRLTTQLMQQILSPLPSLLMHGKQPFNLECGVYNIAKSALGEACRLMAGTERENESAQKIRDIKIIPSTGQTRTWNMAKEVAMTKLVERFMERIKRLDFELAR
ncbi:hypothetical protein GOP47_0005097 [Adiantum capillus-veneris]|nr:hypothetical protein GOP47_0005097 [Adiantum capillus-veneris]